MNAAGCDSVLTIDLTVNKATAYTLSQAVCDSVRINGTKYTASGIYKQTLTNAAGCDSVLTIDLTVNQATAGTLDTIVCDSLRINGTRYTAAGVYKQTLTNAAGCDSTLTINLTVKQSAAYTLTQTVSDSVRINGTKYTASGTYYQTLTNAAGCDSTLTLNLTVHSSDAALTNLWLSIGALTPDFHPDSTYYTVEGFSYDMERLWINATARHARASVSGNDEKYLNVGKNTFSVVVTAEDGTQKTYTVVVTREAEFTAISAAEWLPLTLYPTITNGELKIENGEWGSGTFSTFNSQLSIEIYNLSGALVATVPAAGGRTTVNVSALPSGTYIVKAGKYAGKFVKR
jgi:hypothetical protein